MDTVRRNLDDPTFPVSPCLMPPPHPAPPPSFFLYGEPAHPADDGFLHLETLDTRSRPNRWNIRPHRHDDLNHVFLLVSGGGDMLLGETAAAFESPCLLIVPAGAVHGFAFRRESVGSVLTVASSFLADRDPLLVETFRRPQIAQCAGHISELEAVFGRLGQELAWRAPAQAMAVEACVLQILVLILRLQQRHALPEPGEAARDAMLIARFHEQVELHFRHHQPLESYCKALGVSPSRLRQSCRRAAGLSPSHLIRNRLIGEAKRALLYSDMRICNIAHGLGFEDLAYFSRMFKLATRLSPRRFRSEAHASLADPDL